MKYVKLTAKPDTWFKEGTEVYNYYSTSDCRCRVTLDEWEEVMNFQKMQAICVAGIHIPDAEYEIEKFGTGERWDGEFCSCDEFEVEIVDEPR